MIDSDIRVCSGEVAAGFVDPSYRIQLPLCYFFGKLQSFSLLERESIPVCHFAIIIIAIVVVAVGITQTSLVFFLVIL